MNLNIIHRIVQDIYKNMTNTTCPHSLVTVDIFLYKMNTKDDESNISLAHDLLFESSTYHGVGLCLKMRGRKVGGGRKRSGTRAMCGH